MLADEAKGTNLSAKIVFTPGSGEYRQWAEKRQPFSARPGVSRREDRCSTQAPQGLGLAAELVFRNAEGNKLRYPLSHRRGPANTSGDEEESVGDELDESDDDGEWDEGAEAADEIHVSEEGLY